MRLLNTFFIFLIALLASGVRCAAAEEMREAELRNSIVVINVSADRDSRSGSGFIVQSNYLIGYVVTNAALIAGAETLTVIAPGTGKALVAQVIRTSPELDVAILKVNGLGGRPLVLANGMPRSDEAVWSAIKWSSENSSLGLAQGKLLAIYQMQNADGQMLSHSADVNGAAGAVLLNDCGQVIGLNVGGSTDGVARAIDNKPLIALLNQQNVRLLQAETRCVPVIVQAREQAALASAQAKRAGEEAQRAQQAAEDLEARLHASNQRNTALEAEARAARQRADQAFVAAESARKNAQDTRVDLERQSAAIKAETDAMMKFMERERSAAELRFQNTLAQQRAESASREQLMLVVGGATLLIAIIVAFFALRGRSALARPASISRDAKHRVSGSTELHKQELVEYVLDGRDEDGIRYLLRISGDQLTNPDGVVIGRNPQDSPYIINHADVSRKHARMKVMKNRVFIEDLGSTNGTSVNGQSIDDKGPVTVSNGDQIIIGSVVMKLRVLGA